MKELKFIHITKCAGTSVEDAGDAVGIKWGRYHTEYYLPKSTNRWWHSTLETLDINIVKKYDWFMVVRNPYDRILSEYYCRYNGYINMKNKNSDETIEEMNNFLITQLKKRINYGAHYTEQNNGAHYTQQFKYLHKNAKIHVLKFENLDDEFNKLMKKYNIHNITLIKSNSSPKIKNFTVSDFSEQLIKLINEFYHEDFKLFNYTKKLFHI